MSPEGWSTTRLGTAFSKRTQRGCAGLPTLSVTLDDGLVPRDSIDRKMETSLAPEEHLLVERGDIAYNTMRMWQGASGLAAERALVSPAYVVLRAQPHVDPLFAAYLFKHPRMVYLFWAYSYGLTEDRLRLYFDDFCLVPVDIPPVREQRRIAEILSTWDRAIETVEALIANARQQKVALMQALLTGKRRLPGFDRPWRQVTLGELGAFRKGKGISRSDVKPSGLPCVRYGEIYTLHHDVIQKFGSFIDDASASLSEPINRGDILFACSGETAEEIGKCVTFDGPERAYAGGDIVVFTPRGGDSSVFLAYLLNSNKLAIQKAQMGQGNAVVHISAANLGKLRFAIPEQDEQNAIAEHLQAADALARCQTTKLAALKKEKAALMQQLLTGKRRVKAAESEAA